MKYGLPYKGSKNKLAERIVSLLPKRTHLIDLFCGGCAVSHAALLRNKYEHIHINDINRMCPTLFIDALNGKYQNETRWISREDFFRLKDTDPYVAVVWSFGNNLRTYLYSKEIEPLKKAIHYAIFFNDYSLGKELGYDFSFIDKIDDYQKRYIAIKRYMNDGRRHQSLLGGVRISSIGECRKMEHKSHLSKKNTNAQATSIRRKTQLHCTDCNIESDNYPCREIRGGNLRKSHQVCLIISKLKYPMIA